MIFRYARHTDKLEPLIEFYTQVIGLENLGGFKNHSTYDGVFLGNKNSNWHLEFTTSNDLAEHSFDEDDLLVFYVDSKKEMDTIVNAARQFGVQEVQPKNSYWKNGGITFLDPDGFRVVVYLKK